MTIIKHKRGTGIPSPSDLSVGEIAIDISTGTAYTKASDGRVVSVGGNSSGGDGELPSGPTSWDEITGKPSTFPPESHTHEIEDVNGLQDALNNGSGPPVYVNGNAPENPAKGSLWYDTNSGELNLFDGNDWVVIGSGGGNVVLLLPVSSRSGALQLPLNQDGDAVPVMLRSGASELPLNNTGNKFTVNTRSGDLDLPLMVA